MTTRVQNPMTSGGGGGCPWTCETPCVAEMFQKCAEYFDNAGLPPIPDSIPYVGAMAFRARKKGPAGRGGAKDLSDRMAAVAMGQPGEDLREEANLLEQLGALGWDEYPWSDVRTQVPQLAAFLRSKGLERGDRLCLFADAGFEALPITYIVNRLIDLIFAIDLVLNFFRGYQEADRNGGQWIMNESQLAMATAAQRQYVTTESIAVT